ALCSIIERPVKPILDLACGAGLITRSMTGVAQGQPVVGFDRDFFLLYVAKNWLATEAFYVCGDGDQPLPFGDDTLSAVFCSGAFEFFTSKAACIRELKRLTRTDGTIILATLPTDAKMHPATLSVAGYEALVADIPHRLVPGVDILSRYLQKQGPSLTHQAEMERVAEDPWLSVVASQRAAVFRDHGRFEDWPHANGNLRLDPLYREVSRDEQGNVHLRRVFPSAWFEYETGEYGFKDYLPETVAVGDRALTELSQGHRTPEVEALIGRGVVLGFPDRYIPATYVKEEAVRTIEPIGGTFYVESVEVSNLLAAVIPSGHAFIMVDESEWDVGEIPERRAIRFLERDGQYWGPPH